MKLHTTTALLLAALALPLAAAAQDPQDPRDGSPNEVYPAEPVGPEQQGYPEPQGYADQQGAAGPQDYDVSVDLDGGSSVSQATFDAPLRGYGDWVSVGAYGNVWRPRVPAGWRPYYYGRWEWTTEGWLWVSDEPFGWATYHYGRWTFDRGYGWLWVPGYQWAPAWVSWRYSGDVVGWAPLAPGLSLYVTDFAFVDFWWTFMPTTRFCGVHVHGAAYAPGHSRRWYDATRPAPPRPSSGSWRPSPGRPAPPAWGGPAPRFIEERVGRPLRPSRIVQSAGPGIDRARPGEIGVYRPEARPRPAGGGAREDGRWQGGARPSSGWDRSATPRERGGSAAPPARGQAPGRETYRPAPGVVPRDRGAAPPARAEQPWRGGERPPASQGAPAYRPPVERAPAYQAPPERAPAYQPPARSAPEPAPSRGGGSERGGSDRGRGDRGEHRR